MASAPLIAVDWAPNDGEGDKILYIFNCGEVGDASQIELRDGEIDLWKWVPVSEVAEYAIPSAGATPDTCL